MGLKGYVPNVHYFYDRSVFETEILASEGWPVIILKRNYAKSDIVIHCHIINLLLKH